VDGELDSGASAIDRGLAELCERHRLDATVAVRLRTLLTLVSSDPHAPTTVRDPLRVLRDHLADSLVALEMPEVGEAEAIADIGSGPGFPGLPLAIALPVARVALVEASARKCEFIARAVHECAIANASVVNARAESWGDGIGGSDLVTARALAPLDVVAEYAAPLLRIGGMLIVWRGQRDPFAEAAAVVAAAQLDLEPREVRRVSPYPGASHRHLHLFLKVSATPPRFPRRPGVARKRPLGGAGTASDRSRR
jgi:16S rRNA (guanine527-N7)-methyltransferase